ncbi:MAG: trehalose-phosphatase [Siculibacillus sp.]|nr:trehalose-phosphatase [Siculibacillus sp.]
MDTIGDPHATAGRIDPVRWIESRAEIALFLDFDGTLVDVATRPEDVAPPPGLVELLDRLHHALGGALAIVSGRRIADLDRLLAPATFVAAGLHGSEYRTDRTEIVRPVALPIDPEVVTAVSRLERIFPGVRVEPKGATMAVHWREAPGVGEAVAAELVRILDGGSDHLELTGGRMVHEIHPRHVSEGAAVEILSGLVAFRGRRPVMIGDDVSDESGIAAAERAGGVGFRVRGETFGPDVADFASPRQVREWLSLLLSRIGS